MDSSILNFISEGDFEIDSTLNSFPRLQQTLIRLDVPYYKSVTEEEIQSRVEEKKRFRLLQKLEEKLGIAARGRKYKLDILDEDADWGASKEKSLPYCDSLTDEERELKLEELEKSERIFKREVPVRNKNLKNSNILSNVIFLRIADDYWLENGSSNVLRLAYFLKDSGLEFIYPFHVKFEEPKFHFSYLIHDSIFDTPHDHPIHISDFLNLPSNLAPEILFKSNFKNCLDTYIYGVDKGDYDEPYKHDWEREAFNTAFKGDTSNFWNVD